jgi:hypothetical protein
LPGIDGLDALAQQFAQDAAGVDTERQHAGKGTQADGGDEHQREHKFIHGAEEIHEPPRQMIEQRVRRQITGPQQPQRHSDDDGQDGTPQGDAHGDDTLPGIRLHMYKRGVEIALEEDADVAQIAQ